MSSGTVLITGTSTGIGEACVARLARAGWKIYAGVRKAEDGERIKETIKGDITPVILDVTLQEQRAAVLQQIERETGVLNGLVNNAGIAVGGPVEVLKEEDWRWQFDVNFFSLVSLTREAMPLMDKGDGHFVHIGSIAGRLGSAGLGPYSASKHAMEGFNWALRGELSRNTTMHSSLIEPGEIKTAIWDKAIDALKSMEKRMDEAGKRERYQFILDSSKGFIKGGATRGIDPDNVAKAVEHALTSDKPKARYLVGTDAKIAGHLVTKLSDRVREKLLISNNKRMEEEGRKN